MNFVSESSILQWGAVWTDKRQGDTAFVFLGSSRGTTCSISVHVEGEIRNLQQCALFDDFVCFAASLIMLWSGSVPVTVHLRLAYICLLFGHTRLQGLACRSESTSNNPGDFDDIHKMARLLIFHLLSFPLFSFFFWLFRCIPISCFHLNLLLIKWQKSTPSPYS